MTKKSTSRRKTRYGLKSNECHREKAHNNQNEGRDPGEKKDKVAKAIKVVDPETKDEPTEIIAIWDSDK